MKKIVVITGASSGIGLETARLFEKTCVVYNLSRRDAQGSFIHITTDVSDEMSVKNAFSQIALEQGRVDLLINCAGFGISGAVEFTEMSHAKRIFDVNFFGAFLCCKYAAPLLRKTKGRIINISSAAAVFAIPFQGFYSASKAALSSLTLCLRSELGLFGITVCALLPGDVKTGFTAARVKSEQGEGVYGGCIQRSVGVMERDEGKGMSPEAIARYIHKISAKKRVRPLYTPGMLYKLYALLFKLLPASAVNFLVAKIYITSELNSSK